jgi:NAD+ synthase (glutamine-hydrolysing)
MLTFKANSSGSHFELRKLHTRLELIQGATKKIGGCYLYANQIGYVCGSCYHRRLIIISMPLDIPLNLISHSLSEINIDNFLAIILFRLP